MKKFISRATVALVLFFLLPQTVDASKLLVPVGQIIGLALEDDTVTVAAFDDTLGAAAKKAGLKIGDRIVQVDARTIRCSADIRQALERSDGTVEVAILRNGKTKKLHLTPAVTKDGPKLGIYLKEGVTGVGTVTWYDPDTGNFGALGHGVNDACGKLLKMKKGTVYEASIISVRKGKIGTPGQLMGSLNPERAIGSLTKNTAQGVFGSVTAPWDDEALSVASAEEIKTGSATIRSTIEGTTVREYSVEILKIYPNSKSAGRNMLIKITDPALLACTGGIVQGMSGSPIIQNGQIVGAVTHVLVNDPTTGYGIFIENMLDAAA